ncbi:hypothetical protein As57867_001669, partial [Aphanomyces stellatus]
TFHRYGFPSYQDQPFYHHVDLRFDDNHGFTYVAGFQYITGAAPIDLVVVGFRDQLCHALGVNGPRPILQTTAVESTNTNVLHQLVTDGDESVNLLCGQFYDPLQRRGVLVAQQIQVDERRPHNRAQRNRMLWFERVALPCGTRNLVRMLYVMQHQERPSGDVVPLADEARHFAIDFRSCHTDSAREAYFRREIIAFGEKSFHEESSRLEDVCQNTSK